MRDSRQLQSWRERERERDRDRDRNRDTLSHGETVTDTLSVMERQRKTDETPSVMERKRDRETDSRHLLSWRDRNSVGVEHCGPNGL